MNLCNNPEKIFPTVHLDIKEYTYEGKVILYVYVHESSDVHKSANKIFDRNEDGDFDITANTTQISNLYIRKSSTYIEDDQRINVRDVIARELCANLLIHREYSNPYPAKLIITSNAITTENASKARVIGFMDLNNYSPYPKNPKIAGFFKEIGLADELGSGIKKIVKYTKIYSGGIPEFREDEVFSAKIPLVKTDDTGNEYISSQKLKELILNFIKGSSGKTRKEINDYIYPILNQDIKIMDSRVRTSLTYLRKKNLIENGGSDTKSTWLEK